MVNFQDYIRGDVLHELGIFIGDVFKEIKERTIAKN